MGQLYQGASSDDEVEESPLGKGGWVDHVLGMAMDQDMSRPNTSSAFFSTKC
jgi:hypothetical protein